MNKLFSIVRRPWGWMVTLLHANKAWIKIIRVLPGECTSEQSHNERREIHIKLYPTLSIKKVASGERHRMFGGLYLEVAYGHPREEDVVRYDDKYGRT
ncbi:MAG: hypothetical protein ISR99_02410 [Parcubacteria group bacterium]|nr:hypothetical protein [Parcubacteria group bacterium]